MTSNQEIVEQFICQRLTFAVVVLKAELKPMSKNQGEVDFIFILGEFCNN